MKVPGTGEPCALVLQGEKESRGLETLPQTADPKEGHDEDDGAEHGGEVRRRSEF